MAQQQQPSSSLPKLTAFLRGGSAPDADSASRGAEKRRHPTADAPAPPRGMVNQHEMGEHDQHSRQLYGHEDSAMEPNPRQRRRSNMFVQYGEGQFAQQATPGHPYDSQTPQINRSFAPPPSAVQRPESYPAFSGEQPRTRNASPSYARPGSLPPPEAPRVAPVNTAFPAPVVVSQEPAQRERTSRYLSEADRRAIILRIDNGEKQVALAKEFLVSRAAICNLYKNRHEVLTRADRNPAAKHPKRQKDRGTPKAAELPEQAKTVEDKDTSDSVPVDDDPMSEEHSNSDSDAVHDHPPQQQLQGQPLQVARVYDACSLSYPIRRLISILRNPLLPLTTYRQLSQRLTRCLLEEVVACLPQRRVSISTASGQPLASTLPLSDASVCGISIEQPSTLMLQAFTDIFPGATTGVLSLVRHRNQPQLDWAVQGGQCPPIDASKLVLLFSAACSTGNRVCAALDHLVAQQRISPSSIFVATMISSKSGIARVQSTFPAVTIISGVIDESLDERGQIIPGIGDASIRTHFAPASLR